MAETLGTVKTQTYIADVFWRNNIFRLHPESGAHTPFSCDPTLALHRIDATRAITTGIWHTIVGLAHNESSEINDTIQKVKASVGSVMGVPPRATSFAAITANSFQLPTPLLHGDMSHLKLLEDTYTELPPVLLETNLIHVQETITHTQKLAQIGMNPLGICVVFDAEDGTLLQLEQATEVPVHSLVTASGVVGNLWLQEKISDAEFETIHMHLQSHGQPSALQTMQEAVDIRTRMIEAVEVDPL